MKAKKFNSLANLLFGAVLEPFGFSASESKYCTFYKKVNDSVYLFIMPDLAQGGSLCNIKVFFSSPLINPSFANTFPDDIAIPSDVYCFLHSTEGVGFRQELFPCDSDQQFKDIFEATVKRALHDKALPYLSNFNEIKDMIPFIKTKFYLAVSLYITGQKNIANPILESEKSRLSNLNLQNEAVKIRLDFIDSIQSS